MLKIEDFVPINIEKVRKERDKVYNIPNSDWEKIKINLEVINSSFHPYTLRTYKLNHLPYCVIEIINQP
jgi:hypothetical protein